MVALLSPTHADALLGGAAAGVEAIRCDRGVAISVSQHAPRQVRFAPRAQRRPSLARSAASLAGVGRCQLGGTVAALAVRGRSRRPGCALPA